MSPDSNQRDPEGEEKRRTNKTGRRDYARQLLPYELGTVRCAFGWLAASFRNPYHLPHHLTWLFTMVLAIFAYYAWNEATRGTRAMQGQLDEMKKSFTVDRPYVLKSAFDGYGNSPVKPG